MIKPVDYKQYDPKWANHNYSAPGESKTIKTSGCGPTSAADILATLIDSKITPVDTAEWSMAHGYKYKNQGTAYAYFTPQFKEYGLTCKMLNSNDARNMSEGSKLKFNATIRSLLQEPGNFVIACMGPGNWTSGGHYIVAYKMDNQFVYICDPASSSAERACNSQSLFFQQIKYAWSVKWGTKTTAKSRGKLYAKKDVTSKRIDDIFTSDPVWVIKDCKDGWSKVCTSDNVGYCKNNLLKAAVLSSFPKATVTQDCWLKAKNNKTSKKLLYMAPGDAVQVITRHKFWTYVNTTTDTPVKGWIKTKFLKEE